MIDGHAYYGCIIGDALDSTAASLQTWPTAHIT